MKTGIIPDIHNKVSKVDRVLASNPEIDRWVFLGDYFDDFRDNLVDTEETALAVVRWLDLPNSTLLLGNHDLSYLWPIAHGCSGYTKEKEAVIKSILPTPAWNGFQTHTWVDGWLVTHAGLDRYWVQGGESPTTLMIELEGSYINALEVGVELNTPLLSADQDSGGYSRVGGITWRRWNSIVPIPSLRQIFGHTPARSVRRAVNNELVCLDTNLRNWAVIEDGVLEVKEILY